MPNGGQDCCGTCWFNRKNKGELAYEHSRDPGETFCEIRNVDIDDPFNTYCTNHPFRSPDQDTIPIGPIYVDKGKGRQLWHHSPDTESIRTHLLELLEKIQEQPRLEYEPGHASGKEPYYRDEVVVWQLGEFEEQRALKDLKRIVEFYPAASAGGRTRETLIEAAREAMTGILGDGSSAKGSETNSPPSMYRSSEIANVQLNADLQSMEQERDDLFEHVTDVENELSEAEERRITAERERDDLEIERQRLEYQVSELEIECQRLEDQVSELANEVDRLRNLMDGYGELFA